MILFQSQIAEHQQLAEHYRELAAKREALAQSFIEVQSQAQIDLGSLKALVEKCSSLGGNNVIASLKTAVLELFGTDDGNDGRDQQPPSPTPFRDLTPGCDDEEAELLCINGETGDYLLSDGSTSVEDEDEEPLKSSSLTYAQVIKNRCSACWGYEVKSKADIKAGFINRANLNFMEAVNLERSGREFYEAVEGYLNKLYYNGQSYEWASPFASPLACLLWEDASLTEQKCDWNPPVVDIPQPNESPTAMVILSANCGYLKLKADGRILATYCWFSRKNIAEAWLDHLETIHTAKVEMRESKRSSSWKWEIKIVGLSMAQLERLAQEKLHQKPGKQTPAQAAGIEPPAGWQQVQIESQPEPLTCILEEAFV